MITIRVATLSDAKSLASLAEHTFQDTFSEQNTPDDMQLHCESSYGQEIQEKEISNPEYVTFVAESDSQLIAYAQLRWGPSPKCVAADSPGEIQRLYVDKAWYGKGIAQLLMSACLKEMKERNTDLVWLGVWEKNPRAISFYKKCSFNEVGEHEFLLGNDLQRDIILVLPIKYGV